MDSKQNKLATARQRAAASFSRMTRALERMPDDVRAKWQSFDAEAYRRAREAAGVDA